MTKGIFNQREAQPEGTPGPRRQRLRDICRRNAELESEIAQRIRTEEALRQTTQTLEQAVEIADNLAAEARRANQAKSLFLASMSHELRTPLNGLLGALQLLRETPLDGQQGELLGLAELCGGNLLHLLNDILDLSYIESEEFKPQPVLVPLQPFAESILSILRPEVTARKLDLVFTRDDSLPEAVRVDAGRLRQILLNLLANAVKFTHQGGITLSLRGQPDHRGLLWLQWTVTDTGVGIREDDLPRIFTPYARGEEGIARRTQGAGLGLPIVKQLCERLGGTITLKSRFGSGTTVQVALPVEPAPLAAATAGHEGTAPKLAERYDVAGCRVLLVEDNPLNQQMMRMVLEKLRCPVAVASNGHEAMHLLAQETFDLILLDIRLPDMTGQELFATLRSGTGGALNRATPVVALTAYAGEEDRKRLLAAGIDGYLAKPVSVDELALHLRRFAGTA